MNILSSERNSKIIKKFNDQKYNIGISEFRIYTLKHSYTFLTIMSILDKSGQQITNSSRFDNVYLTKMAIKVCLFKIILKNIFFICLIFVRIFCIAVCYLSF